MATAKPARAPLTVVSTHDRPCLQPNTSTPPTRLSPRSRPSLPPASRRLAAIQRDEEVEKDSERQERVLKKNNRQRNHPPSTPRELKIGGGHGHGHTVMSTEAPCVEIKDKRANHVRCGFEGRKQPAQLTFFPISPPSTVDCCIPEEAGSIAWGPGRPAGTMIRLSLKISGEATCRIGPNYVAVHGEYLRCWN